MFAAESPIRVNSKLCRRGTAAGTPNGLEVQHSNATTELNRSINKQMKFCEYHYPTFVYEDSHLGSIAIVVLYNGNFKPEPRQRIENFFNCRGLKS
jgi:hypothetical protein